MARPHHRLQVGGGSVPGIHDLPLFLIPHIGPVKRAGTRIPYILPKFYLFYLKSMD